MKFLISELVTRSVIKDKMKAFAMYTILAVILWACACVSAQEELNINCTLTPVITPQLKKTLLQYFEKSSKIKLLEYVLVFDNDTNKQNSTESIHSKPCKNWKWYRTQEHGSVYFLFMDEYFHTFSQIFDSIKTKVKIRFQANPLNCLEDQSACSQSKLVNRALLSDFGLKGELQNLLIDMSKNIEICLNNNSRDFFKYYRCCSFNRWNELYCNEQGVIVQHLYFSAPLIISFFIALYILCLTPKRYRSKIFTSYTMAETETDELGRLVVRKSTTLNKTNKAEEEERRSDNKREKMQITSSNLINIESSSWPMFGYYIQKIREHECCKYFCWWQFNNSLSIFTLLLLCCVLNAPYLALCIERFNGEDRWGNGFTAVVVINFIICLFTCICSCIKDDIWLLKVDCQEFKADCIAFFQLFIWLILFIDVYFSIVFYVKFIFVLISFAFFELEKTDLLVSFIIVVFIYVYGFCKDDNLSFRKCLIEFEQELDKVIHENRHQQTINMTFWFECTGYENLEKTIEGSEHPGKKNEGLAIFCDEKKNTYFKSNLFYDCCIEYFKEIYSSGIKISGKILMRIVLVCYVAMLVILVWYFDSQYEYSFGNTVFIVISGGMLPKLLTKVTSVLSTEEQVQKSDTRFLKLVENEIEARYKMASKNVLLFVGRTGNGKTSSIRSILKDRIIVPYHSTTENAAYTEDNLELIDGTGIGDNGEDMIVNAEDLIKSISRIVTNGFTSLVFVIRYGVGFTKQEVDAVKTVKSIFGNDVFKKWGIILITFGDKFDDDNKSFIDWCKEQKGDFKKLFDECGNRCVLLNSATNEPSVLESQRERFIKQVEDLKICLFTPYRYRHFKRAERSRNNWEEKNKCSTSCCPV